ncbi:hypothetical protein IJG66_01920 [Candidatus Saccharibacteria bacterium]|nr:hypothetical protein [Candidatus Saccharibacteria bacterium]
MDPNNNNNNNNNPTTPPQDPQFNTLGVQVTSPTHFDNQNTVRPVVNYQTTPPQNQNQPQMPKNLPTLKKTHLKPFVHSRFFLLS